MRTAALLVLLCACTTSRTLPLPLNATDLRTLNSAMDEREVDLSFASASDWVHVDAAQVHLTPAQARFTVDGHPREVPLLALHSVNFLSPGRPRLEGAAQGLLFGAPLALAGAVVGLSAALSCPAQGSCATETVAPLLVGAVLGLVVAPVAGALIGHHDEVTFTQPR